MKTRNSTKSKLLSSVIALVLCVSMLIGATFAWFTDTASTGVNKIQAGNLDIQLLAEDGTTSLEGKTLSWQKVAGHGNESVLWEPGCTYFTDGFQIKNAGDLNLKFKIAVNGITSGDATLLNAIDFYLTTTKSNDLSSTGAIPLNSFTSGEFKLAPGKFWKGTTDSNDTGSTPTTIYLAGHMKEDAGNEYQGLSIDGIGITVYATQMEAEFDSFNNSYDHDADYIERHATIMNDANGQTITLEAGKTYTVGNATVTVEANGDISYTNNGNAQTVTIETNGGTLTVDAPLDTVNHYGEANFVNVTAVAGNSYHEFGKVAVLSLAKGRVVVENGDNIGVIQVKPSAAAATNPVVIAVPENVVLDTKIERTNATTAFKLDVLNSNGTAIEEKSKEVNSETIPAAPSGELEKVLGTGGIANGVKNYVARIGNNFYESISAAVAAAQSGDTVTLLKDVAYATNGNDLFNITKSITLDGNGHKITGYGNRSGNNTTLAINNSGTDMVSVELKNLTIDNAGTSGRAVETRGNIASLKITNCKFNCTGSGNTQVLTIGGYQSSAANVIINQSALSAGDAGYPIIAFNPINLKIENESVMSGYCGIFFKGVNSSEGSHGSTVTAENSEFDCPNVHSSGGSNDFGVFSLEDDNINITVTNCKINAQAQGTARQDILMASSYADRTSGFSITIAGDSFVNGNLLSMSNRWVNGYTYSITGGTFSTDPSEYCTDGTIAVKEGSQYKVVYPSFDFSDAAQAKYFCADCYNAKIKPEIDPNHSTHIEYLKVENGVAEVRRTGAWLAMQNLTWDGTYVLEYDVDVSQLAKGAFVAFDSGEQTAWQDLHLGIKNENGKFIAYNTIFTNQLNDTNKLGEVNAKFHVKYTFAAMETEAGISMTMEVSDAADHFYTVQKTSTFTEAVKPNLCWDVYTCDGSTGVYATLDNVKFTKTR